MGDDSPLIERQTDEADYAECQEILPVRPKYSSWRVAITFISFYFFENIFRDDFPSYNMARIPLSLPRVRLYREPKWKK
jgi:hypothetical protein